MKKAKIGTIIRKTIKYLFWAVIIAACLSLVVLVGAYGDLRQAAGHGLAGKDRLTASVEAAKRQEWSEGVRTAEAAGQNFQAALDDLGRARQNNAIRFLPPIRRQIDDLEYLLKTGEILSRALEKIYPVAQGLDDIRSGSSSRNFSDLPAADKERFLRYVYESEPELNGLRANLELALLNLDRIHRIGILWPVYGQISQIKGELEQAVEMLSMGSPLLKLLPALAGYPQESRFLLVMQNNDELRPSGGFIGVYGLMEVQNGVISHLETDDSYHVDMPASQSDRWQVKAPEILQKQLKVEKWYLRDANWSPDWPQSARQVEYIYNGVTGATGQVAEPFTGIIGITPDLVADLIGLVGPITVRGETYTEENFQPLLQYNVEIAYRDQNIDQWDRKEVVDELLAELKARLFSLPSDKWTAFFDSISTAIARRDLQLYFDNSAWQSAAQALRADGSVRQTNGDYLMVADANLAAFKSDAVVKKNISYDVSEDGEGLVAVVRLSYRHEGGFDWRTTRYRSYTRVYAPLGSRFISLDNVDPKTADQNVNDDTTLNKTVFGFFFTVEPGDSREVVLRYRLPDNIVKQWHDGGYTLTVQRQAGRRTENLRVRFNPQKGRSGEWTVDLLTDKDFWFKGGKR